MIEEADRPWMLIADVIAVGMNSLRRIRGAGLVVARRIFLRQQSRQGDVIEPMIGKDDAVTAIVPVPIAPFDFVVAAPRDEAGVTREATDIVGCFGADVVEEGFIGCRISAAGEDKFLP